MVTTVNDTLTLHYGELIHEFYFIYSVGETAVERHGNAIRIFWKYAADGICDPYRDAFDIAVDDIGNLEAKVHPLNFGEHP